MGVTTLAASYSILQLHSIAFPFPFGAHYWGCLLHHRLRAAPTPTSHRFALLLKRIAMLYYHTTSSGKRDGIPFMPSLRHRSKIAMLYYHTTSSGKRDGIPFMPSLRHRSRSVASPYLVASLPLRVHSLIGNMASSRRLLYHISAITHAALQPYICPMGTLRCI